MKKIATILSLALQERDMRIHELVRLSGVSKSSVYRVLGEECVPSWDMALNLIESLGGKVEIVFPGGSSPDGHPDL